MGKLQGAILFKNKVGNVVARKGRNADFYVSLYQPTVKNPNTLLQQQTRAKFKLLTAFTSVCQNFVNIGLKQAVRNGETWNAAFVRINFPEGITGTFPAFTLNYSKLILSRGPVDNPYSPAAQVQGTDLSISWTDNSGIGNALETDKVMFIAYNTVKKQAVIVTDAADRSTRQASYSLPTAWVSDSIEVYLAVRRAEGADTSSSLYLGNFNL